MRDSSGLPLCTPTFGDGDVDGLPDDWESEFGLDPFDPVDAGLDSEGDGVINRLEWAFGLDPFLNDGDAIAVINGILTRRGLPTVFLTNTPGGADFRALFGRRKDAAANGLTYTPQFSSDLVVWVNSTAVPTATIAPVFALLIPS